MKVEIRIEKSISYADALAWQIGKFEERVKAKKNGKTMPMTCMLCTHKPVYTLGKSANKDNFLLNKEWLKAKNIDLFEIKRGGDITFHGPGQWVLYPIFDLDQLGIGVKDYVFKLEQIIINVLQKHNVNAIRVEGFTGVWLGNNRKIAALGIKVSRYITMHGLALNINTDLKYFDYIVPCGIKGKSVTTLSDELHTEVNMDILGELIVKEIENVFDVSLV